MGELLLGEALALCLTHSLAILPVWISLELGRLTSNAVDGTMLRGVTIIVLYSFLYGRCRPLLTIFWCLLIRFQNFDNGGRRPQVLQGTTCPYYLHECTRAKVVTTGGQWLEPHPLECMEGRLMSARSTNALLPLCGRATYSSAGTAP